LSPRLGVAAPAHRVPLRPGRGGCSSDQKWVDVGSVLFEGQALRHYGYNVSLVNLHERPIARDADGYVIDAPTTGSASTTSTPSTRGADELTTRFALTKPMADREASRSLRAVAAVVLEKEGAGSDPSPDYVYNVDTAGGDPAPAAPRLPRGAAGGAGTLPSPFVAAEADAYERWRRGRTPHAPADRLRRRQGGPQRRARGVGKPQRRLPGLTKRIRGRSSEKSGCGATEMSALSFIRTNSARALHLVGEGRSHPAAAEAPRQGRLRDRELPVSPRCTRSRTTTPACLVGNYSAIGGNYMLGGPAPVETVSSFPLRHHSPRGRRTDGNRC